MQPTIIINPRTVPITDRAFNYGDGLFETILVKDGQPKHIVQHIKRLHLGCSKLTIVKPTIKTIENAVKKSIGRTKDCIIKIILSRGLSHHGYSFDNKTKPRLYVIKKNKKDIVNSRPITLGYSKYTVSDNSYLSKIKHLNRIEQILGLTMSSKSQFDDFILLNKKKYIIETISSNIFFYNNKNNSLDFYTPDLSDCGVDGIMKNIIIKFLKKNKIKIIERKIKENTIKNYDGAFICNSITGIRFIKKIDKYNFKYPDKIKILFNEFIYE